jgi:phage shock protein C
MDARTSFAGDQKMEAAMYCTSCGKEMRETDVFCAQCGYQSGQQPPRTGPAGPRLSRDMAGKKIAGVCAGIAKQYQWDVTLVRLAFLIGILFHGLSLLVYLLCWMTMPRDDQQPVQVRYGA